MMDLGGRDLEVTGEGARFGRGRVIGRRRRRGMRPLSEAVSCSLQKTTYVIQRTFSGGVVVKTLTRQLPKVFNFIGDRSHQSILTGLFLFKSSP
jgi:hypothetical protein